MISGHDPLSTLSFLSSKETQALESAGLATIATLLSHFPKRYEDRRQFDAFPNLPTAKPVCLRGGVIDARTKGFGSTRFYEAVVMDGSGGVFK